MSNMENFDKYVRDALGNYSPALPEGAWEKLWAEQERRKPKAAWYFNKRNIALLAALLLCGTAAFWLAENTFSKNKLTTDNTIAVTDNNIPNNNKTDAAAGNKEKTTHSNDITNAVTSKEIIDNRNSEPGKTTAVTGTNPGEQHTGITTTNNDDVSVTSSNKNHPVVKRKKYITGRSFSIKQSSADMDDADDKIDNATYSSGETTVLDRSYFSSEKISSLSFRNTASVKPGVQAFAAVPCPTIEKDAAGNKSYWEFYAGPDYAARRYTDTSNSVYLEKRKATTSFHSAYSAGIRYTKVFSNGVSIRTGINFSQVNEKFSFIQSNIVQVNYIIDPVTGDTTGSYTVRGTRYKTTHNHYRTIDVPILFGYEMGNGKLHANFNAGAMINLYSWQQGETLDTLYQPVSITTGKGDKLYQYKTNIGVGFTMAASIYYKLNERLHILAEPYIRYNLSPMSKENLSLQEKFTTIGLRLGLRIDLQ